MVSFDGSLLPLASKVTVKGAGPLDGFVEAVALTVYLFWIVAFTLLRGFLQFSIKLL